MSPAIARIRVDLPDPEAPISATISPLATVRPMSLEHRRAGAEGLGDPDDLDRCAAQRATPCLLLRTPSGRR